jgi:hypothetical protein
MLTSTMATNGTPSATAAIAAAAAIQIRSMHPPSLCVKLPAGVNLMGGRRADTPSSCLVEKLYSPTLSV